MSPDRVLPTNHASLASGVPRSARATIFVLSVAGGMSVGPKEGRTLIFGRNRPEVHVCVGEDDPRVSREHGRLVHRDGKWWIENTGRLPLRLPGGRLLFAEEEPVPRVDVRNDGAPVVGRGVARQRGEEANGRAGVHGILEQVDQIIQVLVCGSRCQELDLHVRR